jgi:hypothetical protein
VITSACSETRLYDFSPSGRYILFYESQPSSGLVRYDTKNYQRYPLQALGGVNYFLSDTVIVVYSVQGAYIEDIEENTITQIPVFKPNYEELVSNDILYILQNADQINLVDQKRLFVALAKDYKNRPQQNILIDALGFEEDIFAFFAANNILYSIPATPYIQGPAPIYYPYSLDEQRFWAAADGIHLSQTNQLIVASEQSATAVTSVWPQGWVNDNHAVVYGDGNRIPLVGGSFLFPTLIDVPQPILLLEVPPQYWAENEATP